MGVRFGEKEDELDRVVYDERDLAPATQKIHISLCSAQNLKANTDYYYQIINNKGAYADNRNKPFL